MKKKYILTILLSITFSFFTYNMIYSQIQGSGMGLITTVTSEGAGDITRNPALLGTITNNKVILYFDSSVYYDENDKLNIYISNNAVASTSTNNNYTDKSLIAGFTLPLPHGTVGVSISPSDDKLYVKRKDTLTIPSQYSIFKEITETQELHPQLTCSYGVKTNSQLLGFQLNVIPFQKNINKQKQIIPLVPILENYSYDFIQKDTGVNVSPSFGILTFIGNAQIGFTLKPSTFTVTKVNAHTDIPKGFIGTTSSFNGSWRFQQTEWPSLSAGVYIPIFTILGLAFESGFSMPCTYSMTNADAQENIEPISGINIIHTYILNTSLSVQNHPAITLKGGIRILISNAFDITAGFAFMHFSNDAFSKTIRAKSSYDIYSLTSGMNYVFSQKLTASLFIMASHLNIDSIHDANMSSPSLYLTLKQNVIQGNVGLAISYNL